MIADPLADLATAWSASFSPEVRVRTRDVISNPRLVTLFDRLIPAFAVAPDPTLLTRWLALVEGRPITLSSGHRLTFRRVGHAWLLVERDPIWIKPVAA